MYWNGRERTGEDPKELIARSMHARTRSTQGDRRRRARNEEPIDLGLCPVTRNVVRRFRQLVDWSEPADGAKGRPEGGNYDVFLSFGSPDLKFARRVHEGLVRGTGSKVFFSDALVNHGPFGEEVDRALDGASAFVAVASRPEHLRRPWVRYEWGSFHNDVMARGEPEKAPYLAFVDGVSPDSLPRPFRWRGSLIDAKEMGYDAAIRKLCEMCKRVG